jgi:hypothetical protein
MYATEIAHIDLDVFIKTIPRRKTGDLRHLLSFIAYQMKFPLLFEHCISVNLLLNIILQSIKCINFSVISPIFK